ncbi:helix-turn-helix domain-containing protein [Streptomyces sp. 1331.2]|uniref:helix-turn-helix domain-containing protein n=1 Tax=Streptomyces sp. 1331.2 TaxID=1938835 RepID=UPI000BC38C62|nr:helix-turn-helix transcriptional regulator [Streptomyces sp. 1331.2]SOB84378.1 DNA-binding transcriptional regulator, XRE-family HTH domain [Streptomyces sp. 1331.2]
MTIMAGMGGPTGTGVGPLLRGWRERRQLSQLQLALRADSSARHLSFVENGRARPSRELVLRLAEQLDVPVRERNALLLAAGYAPHYPETPLDAPSMDALRGGMERLLAAHDPYPTVVVDGSFRVLAANRSLGLLLDGVAPHLLQPPLNAIRVTLHPDGLAPRIVNLREWRRHLLERMEQKLELVRSEPLRRLYEEVRDYPEPSDGPADCPADGSAVGPGAEGSPFALPLRIRHEGRILSFLSTIATFNTPLDVTVSELAMETFLPADAETVRFLQSAVEQ